jgi:hypothetical protein
VTVRGGIVELAGRSLLDSLNDPDIIGGNLVVALEVSAILERMGDRWPRRRDQVWEHLSRAIERRLRADEHYQRITETGFLVALARETRGAAVAVATHALQDTLHFFLGAADIEHIRMVQVAARNGAELTCQAFAPNEVQRAASTWTAEGDREPRGDGVVKQSPILTLRTASGRTLEVMIAVQRLRLLIRDRPSILRAAPYISDPRTGRQVRNPERISLDFGDIAAIDAAVMTLARGMWEGEPELGAIIVPASFHTISRTGARTKLLSQAGLIADESRISMICELIDTDPGTPSGRICEAVAMAQTFSRGVFVEAKEPAALKGALSGTRILGISFDASDFRADQAAGLTKKLFAFAEAGKTFGRALIAHSLPSPALVEVCGVAGLTHATARVKADSAVIQINAPPHRAA